MAIRAHSIFVEFPHHMPYREFEGGNFVVQISGSQFSRIHYDQPNNKTIKYGLSCASDKLQSRWEIAGPKIEENLRQVESKILKDTNQNDTPNHKHNPKHNAMLRKDYTTIIGRMLPINPFLEDSFIKVGSGITYSEKLRAFVDSIPEVRQQMRKKFVDRRLLKCPKMFLMQLQGIIL